MTSFSFGSMSDHSCSVYNINGSPRLRGELSCVFPVRMRIRSFFARAHVFFLVAMLAGLSAAFAAPQDSLFGKTIRRITYSQSLDTTRIDPGIKPGDILTRERVKGAIQSLYNSGRFSSIAVETFPEQDGVRVQFNLRLNYYFNRFSISGNVDLGGRSLWESLNLPTGLPFTSLDLEQVRQEVQDYIKGRGYYMVKVEARTVPGPEDRFVDTVFEVLPGDLATIRSVEIGGVPDPKVCCTRGNRVSGCPFVASTYERVTCQIQAGQSLALRRRRDQRATPTLVWLCR